MKRISKAIIILLMIFSLTVLASCGKENNKDNGKSNIPNIGETPIVPYG